MGKKVKTTPLYAGLVEVDKEFMDSLSRHKNWEHASRYFGTYFPKVAGKCAPGIIFRFYKSISNDGETYGGANQKTTRCNR